jgi:hypothetical protein
MELDLGMETEMELDLGMETETETEMELDLEMEMEIDFDFDFFLLNPVIRPFHVYNSISSHYIEMDRKMDIGINLEMEMGI